MDKTGRNDPCHCGSGKKYKKCCIFKDAKKKNANRNSAAAANDELAYAMEEEQFDSLEQMQEFTNLFINKRNISALEEFHGLSPDQMHQFLYHPFESPELVTFNENFIGDIESPMLSIFLSVADAIGENELKATAKGNLPAKLCKQIALEQADYLHSLYSRVGSIHKQDDFMELCMVMHIADIAGLIKKSKGKFRLTQKCQKLLARKRQAQLYLELFKSFAIQYNWAYNDLYDELYIIQQSFLFTLYLLHKYGSEYKHNSFYADSFKNAYPMAIHEIEQTPYSEPEEDLRRGYTVRCIDRFAHFAGLIEVKATENRKQRVFEGFELKTTTLFDNIINFKI